MGNDLDNLYEGPRSERRAKRKKVNRILNMLIILVVILIVFFGGKLIFGDKNVEEQVSSNETNQPKDSNEKTTPQDSEDKVKESPADDQNKKETTKDSNVEEKAEENEPESDESIEVTEGDPESNIVRTIVNPAWKPVGTEQTEPHITNFDADSADRNEMEKAASYATGFDRADMVVWWLGRNGGSSITATVSSKTTKQVQKVYLDWIPNEGWKPTKIEELKENDTETYKNYKNESDSDENDDDDDD